MEQAQEPPISTLREPWTLWRIYQALRGTNRTTLTLDNIPKVDLTGKWIIITGSNSGIGREAALIFAAWGANLVLACRAPSPNTANEPDPTDVVRECQVQAQLFGHESSPSTEWREVDFSILDSVKSFAQWWLDTNRTLDILCNNAGTTGGGKPGVLYTQDNFRLVHQVNFLSHVYLTLQLLPSLARAPSPRIVCTTSCMSFVGRFDNVDENGVAHWAPDDLQADNYADNKLYFQIWLNELQRRMLEDSRYRHIMINGIHPGYVQTGIFNPKVGEYWTADLAGMVLQKLVGMLGITPFQGCFAIVNAATNPELGPDEEGRFEGGRYFNRIWEQENMPHVKDPSCRLRVWRMVNRELKLKEQGLLEILGE